MKRLLKRIAGYAMVSGTGLTVFFLMIHFFPGGGSMTGGLIAATVAATAGGLAGAAVVLWLENRGWL